MIAGAHDVGDLHMVVVDARGERLEDGELGGDFRARDDRDQGALRIGQRAAQRVQLAREQRPRAGGRGESRHAVGRGLGAVRGAEGVVHVDVAERGVLSRQRLVVDPNTHTIYQTEDAGNPNGLVYRWAPPAGLVSRTIDAFNGELRRQLLAQGTVLLARSRVRRPDCTQPVCTGLRTAAANGSVIARNVSGAISCTPILSTGQLHPQMTIRMAMGATACALLDLERQPERLRPARLARDLGRLRHLLQHRVTAPFNIVEDQRHVTSCPDQIKAAVVGRTEHQICIGRQH